MSENIIGERERKIDKEEDEKNVNVLWCYLIIVHNHA